MKRAKSENNGKVLEMRCTNPWWINYELKKMLSEERRWTTSPEPSRHG